MSFPGGTPFPSHNTSTGLMSFPGGTPQPGQDRGGTPGQVTPCPGMGYPPARSGQGYPRTGYPLWDGVPPLVRTTEVQICVNANSLKSLSQWELFNYFKTTGMLGKFVEIEIPNVKHTQSPFNAWLIYDKFLCNYVARLSVLQRN